MHANNDEDFKTFVRQQFSALNENMYELMKNLNFTITRVKAVEDSLQIKVVTPLEADLKNCDPETMEFDKVEPSIDTSASIIIQQRKTIDGLRNLNEMHQYRLKSFTTTVNTLVKSCATFQSILIQNNMLPKDLANTLFPLGDAYDSDVGNYLKELPSF